VSISKSGSASAEVKRHRLELADHVLAQIAEQSVAPLRQALDEDADPRHRCLAPTVSVSVDSE
jgi:hypothetical protein